MKILFRISFLFAVSCCTKKTVQQEYHPVQITCALTNNLDSCKLLIQGNWTWLEELRLDRIQQKFVYLTPQTEGYSLTLQLLNDTARYYKNNKPDSIYTYKILRLSEISGTNFPEDSMPVFVLYNLHNGLRTFHVPLKICSNFLLLQHQFVSSVVGQRIWER
jgi:hypothetical protein